MLANVAVGKGIVVLVVSEYNVATASAEVSLPCARTSSGIELRIYKVDTRSTLGSMVVVVE